MAGQLNRVLVAWIVSGAIGWAGLAWIGMQLNAASPDQVGFDLELLLKGARAFASGRSPYDAAMLAGVAPSAPSLFYSYPPPVAQALVPFAAIPSRVMLLAWDAAAVVGLLFVADAMRLRLAPERARSSVLVPVLACAPLSLPFAVGLLFGNLDVFFPLLYGSMLLSVMSRAVRTRVAGGVALLAGSLKLHPASLFAWFGTRIARGRHERDGRAHMLTLAMGLVTGAIVLGASVIIWGVEPWLEYGRVVQAGTGAEVVDPRNAGIAAQIALLVGGGEGMARAGHLVIGISAVALTIWAARRRGDPIESFAWAAVASLATLPVTWYHYPSALIPIGLAAVLRADVAGSARLTRRLVLAAGVIGGLAIAWLPLLWVSAALVIAAARASGQVSRPRLGPHEAPPGPPELAAESA